MSTPTPQARPGPWAGLVDPDRAAVAAPPSEAGAGADGRAPRHRAGPTVDPRLRARRRPTPRARRRCLLRRAADRPDPAQRGAAPPGLRRGGHGRAGPLDHARSACCSRSWCGRPGRTRYELIMGERRWRASQEAGLTAIPAIVRQTDDVDMLRDALLENLHRSQLNPLEEAAAYSQLLEDFACTHEELASRIGRSRPQISNTIRLMRLSPAVQRRVAAGVLSAGHARACSRRRRRDAGPARAAGRRRGHQRARPGGDRRGGRRRARRPHRAAGAPQADRPRPGRPRRAALGPARDPGEGRARPAQGQDHRRVRLAGRPATHRRRDGPPQPRGPRRSSVIVDK